jgi:hypothetical protein
MNYLRSSSENAPEIVPLTSQRRRTSQIEEVSNGIRVGSSMIGFQMGGAGGAISDKKRQQQAYYFDDTEEDNNSSADSNEKEMR